ncbi:MAG: thermonuclease family protein [Pseudomonadota bacterium]
MKKLLVLALLLTSCGAYAAQPVVHDYQVLRVVDGDTVAFKAVFLPPPLKQELALRIYGVDTPEKGSLAKCQAEKDKAVQAAAFTKAELKSAATVNVELRTWDKYGGRVLGDVLYDGKRLSESLVQAGFASPYFGGKKQSWCK